ncbi:hypothetical protein PoB_002552100 [Plakobranchus ocellatus]|uniref:Uncharacterized protein n=1 Tax=Plakobranchus ocellatus TaxID=259542 RepID=A0AAV3ZSQ5_9GAST|nr:hypothetical protein PoB_002552100 [Plakobranchus ocellatus]
MCTLQQLRRERVLFSEESTSSCANAQRCLDQLLFCKATLKDSAPRVLHFKSASALLACTKMREASLFDLINTVPVSLPLSTLPSQRL